MQVSWHQLQQLQSVLHKARTKRFAGKRKTPKYGTLNKGFTEQELKHFINNVPNEKFRLLFKYQAFLGLRIGEVCKLHLDNIKLDSRELVLHTEKADKTDALRIPQGLFRETVDFIGENMRSIRAASGYIFFKDEKSHKAGNYIDSNYVRAIFRETVKLAGLDDTYATSDETDLVRTPRTLHRLTTHSLRHYAITHFAKATNGNVVQACRFARHSNPGITMRYISRDNTELYDNIDFAFSDKLKDIKQYFSA